MVYVELVLLDNLLMDFILLYFAVRFSERRVVLWRVLLGALAGAVYAAAAVAVHALMLLPIKLAVLAGMCALARGVRPLRTFLHTLASALCAGLLLGGAVLAAVYVLGGSVSGGLICLPGLRYLLAGGCCGALLLEYVLRRPKLCTGEVYRVCAVICGETICLAAMLDTGNRLRDLAGGGVIVADRKAVLSQLSPALRCEIEAWPQNTRPAMRPFYCETAGGDAVLPAVLPDSLTISCAQSEYAAKAYIALGSLHGGDFNAVLSGAIRCVQRTPKGRAMRRA